MKQISVSQHIPVLLEPVLKLLRPADGQSSRVIDGTLGVGGHSLALLDAGANAILAFDLDAAAIEIARQNLSDYEPRVTIAHKSYLQMRETAQSLGWQTVDAILLDLGLSSLQLDDARRGFSFRHDAPLDMRFDPSADLPTACELVNALPEKDLANLLFRYGEEKAARKIAKAIVAHRPITHTSELAQLVASITNPRRRSKKIHPATQVFQALRITVNRELESVEHALPIAVNLLRPGGRLALISYHSLEDRIVKQAFRELSRAVESPPGMASIEEKQARVKLVNRRPIVPDEQEILRNPRSRSAKLRVIEKLKMD